ncbi:MAG: DUF4270 family protein [Bacteroidetes bacterium]|nr:DUF4270 family protein [Bacteroidota bacterium]
MIFDIMTSNQPLPPLLTLSFRHFLSKKSSVSLSMKKITNSAFWMLILLFVALLSCNDPSTIGADLLSGDQLDTEFTDTLTVRARTVSNDSLTVWGPGVNGVVFQNFTFGDYLDPVFGRTVSSIYAQIVTNATPPNFIDSLSRIDSVVFTLAYNTDLYYGKIDEPFTVEVYEMDEQLDVDAKYLNSDSFAVKPMPIGVKTFMPNLTDSITVMEPSSDTVKSVKLPPHLRIQLDTAFAGRIMRTDSLTLVTDSLFLSEVLKGIWLKPASQNAGLLSFIMRSGNTNIRFYYHDGTKKKSYDFKAFTGNPVVLHQRNYYGGSIVGNNIGLTDRSEVFLQGLNGVNIELEIPYAESLQGLIINKAELVFPILTLPEDNDNYEPVSQIYASEIIVDDSVAVLDDIYYASISHQGADFGDYFGGKVTSDDNYKLNIAAQLQRMITGDSKKKLLLTTYLRSERAARVVLGGTSNSDNPAKLKIWYTKY